MAILEKASPSLPFNHRYLPAFGVMLDQQQDTSVLCELHSRAPYTFTPTPPFIRCDAPTSDPIATNLMYAQEFQFPASLQSSRKPQLTSHLPSYFIPPSTPKSDGIDRTSINNSQPHNLGDFEIGTPVLSGVDLEYALLENALNKDTPLPTTAPTTTVALPSSPSPPPPPQAATTTVRPTTGTAVLEPEFYFGDILGDEAVPPPAIPNMIKREDLDDDGVSDGTTVRHGAYGAAFPRDSAQPMLLSQDSGQAETDLSSAFESNSVGLEVGNMSGQDEIFMSDDLSVSASGRDAGHLGVGHGDGTLNSPASGTSMCEKISNVVGDDGICQHPDEYENLSAEIRMIIDILRAKIAGMPRRKLRESLAREVTLEDVEPLMAVNRDELAIMLGLGVTTWKTFMHSLGVPRWPARALKSQKVKEQKLLEKKMEAEKRGDVEMCFKMEKELSRVKMTHKRRRKGLISEAKLRVSNGGVRKKSRMC